MNGSVCDSVKKLLFRVEGMWEVFRLRGRPIKLFLLLYSSKLSCKDFFFCQAVVRFLTIFYEWFQHKPGEKCLLGGC